MKPKKPSAAERTVDMFGANAPEPKPEVIEEDAKAERVSMDEDADRMREKAFTVQDWSTAAFGKPEAEGNQFRVSHKNRHYYVEKLHRMPGARDSHGYTGIMVQEEDLLSLTKVLVEAVREKQKRDAK